LGFFNAVNQFNALLSLIITFLYKTSSQRSEPPQWSRW